jgi:hypothetical protein
MQDDAESFHSAYRALEEKMRLRAESDGDIFLSNPEPKGPVQHVLICMEPSLGGRSEREFRSWVEEGARNFLNSIEDFLLHFSVRQYLCESEERYHITDVSKGAMPVERAGEDRAERYDRWYDLLKEELDLVATSDANIFAVGNAVSEFLEDRGFERAFTRILHYSPQAARARNAGIEGHENQFERFRETVRLEDMISTARDVFEASTVPDQFREETLSRLKNRELTPSRKKLLFNYKLAFEREVA